MLEGARSSVGCDRCWALELGPRNLDCLWQEKQNPENWRWRRQGRRARRTPLPQVRVPSGPRCWWVWLRRGGSACVLGVALPAASFCIDRQTPEVRRGLLTEVRRAQGQEGSGGQPETGCPCPPLLLRAILAHVHLLNASRRILRLVSQEKGSAAFAQHSGPSLRGLPHHG